MNNNSDELSLLDYGRSLQFIGLVAVPVAAGQISLFYAPNVGAYINTLALGFLMVLASLSNTRIRNVIVSAALDSLT